MTAARDHLKGFGAGEDQPPAPEQQKAAAGGEPGIGSEWRDLGDHRPRQPPRKRRHARRLQRGQNPALRREQSVYHERRSNGTEEQSGERHHDVPERP